MTEDRVAFAREAKGEDFASQLVLSLFPGLGLLDRGFEEEGFTVVRGPDSFWGGDVRRFNPPPRRFDGVIGGPPCQTFSQLRRLLKAKGTDTKAVDLIPEFARCVAAAAPRWFLMENVSAAPDPSVEGYHVRRYDLKDCELGVETQRRRRFWFGTADGLKLSFKPAARRTLLPPERAVTRYVRVPDERHFERAKAKNRSGVLPGDGRLMPVAAVCEMQGLPRDFAEGLAFRIDALRIMLGNGVPLAMGRAVAAAVRSALE